MLLDQGHQVDLACNMIKPINSQVIKSECRVFNIELQRSPLSKLNYIAYEKLKKLIQDEKYDLVHTHTPVASACVRLACKHIRNVKVIYTAHGFHFYKGAPLKNWLLYYPIEWCLAKYTDILITINKEDYARAKKNFKAKKVEYIPGVGLDIKKFDEVIVNKLEKHNELGLPSDVFILLSIGELNMNKNHETVIRALAKVNNCQIHYVICGQGPLKNYLKDLIKELGLEKKVHLVGFRSDITEICSISDAFVLPSYREGLSVALMEAMASSLPVVCSKIRGNIDLIDENGGRLFDPYSIDSCKDGIETLLSQDLTALGKYNREKVKKFSTDAVLKKLKNIYSEVD